jgi:outer membrane autotransporter protein
VYGLNVASQEVNSGKTYLGAQVDTTQVLGDSLVAMPYARIAWEHEFSTDRAITGSFESLPGAAFTAYGAPAGADLARVDAGLNVALRANLMVYVGFDGAFSGSGSTYAGRGGLRVVW